MARIPEAEIERLKKEVSLLRLMEAAGMVLQKQGKDYACRCPFHEDGTASLIVTPAKNLYHCFGCGAAGGPIDWVMQHEKISFRHAVVQLQRESGVIAPPAVALAASSLAALPSAAESEPVTMTSSAERQTLLNRVLDYYHDTLKQSPEALAYLSRRGLNHPELIARFRLGYANRTLGYSLPAKQVKAGAEIRGQLQEVGLLRASGHEHFTGSLIVPVIGLDGVVHEVYGRKILDNLRQGTAYHLYLPGAHAGVWNEEGIAASGGEVILCEALIDAMTFWVHGLRNVTASYGVNGFTADHLAVFARHGIKRVLIAYDRDAAGNKAAAELAEQLMAAGMDCFRILFPKDMDANEFALKMQPAGKALALVVRKAEWLGKGKAPRLHSGVTDGLQDDLQPDAGLNVPGEAVSALATAPQAAASDPLPLPTLNSPLPPAPADDTVVAQTDTDLVLQYGDRRYRVRGWHKPLNPEALKVNLLVSRGEAFHVDTLDLYQAKARAAFMKQAGLELGEAEDVLKHDLGRVLLKLEAIQSENLNQVLASHQKAPVMDELERADALALLKDPHLLERILTDFGAMGIVGEATNVLVGYLAAVSRQLDKPLAVLIQSSSAAGKSSLMDAVLALMPDEAQVRFSAMTGQSLFYMGETNLKHKILAIAEEEGAEQASYALKLLQSDGQVTMASTGKDANTGMLVTHEYRVEGPVMLFLTTTAMDIDEELLNRCLVLTVNESREQTRAIHVLQRKRQTLEGLLLDEERDAVQTLHRNAQRLLQPLKVVNPYADQLTFLDDKTRTRRDHMKYLSLIRAITLLHQYQREVKTLQHRGKTVHYIEVTLEDIAIANRLAHDVLGRTLDELPPQTRKLLSLLHEWVQTECEKLAMQRADFRFTRRQVREAIGWGDTQLRLHLGRLAELEYLQEQGGRRGQIVRYELLYSGEGQTQTRFLMGLLDTDTLHSPTMTPDSRGENPENAGALRPQSGSIALSLRGLATPAQASLHTAFHELASSAPQNARPDLIPPAPSYRHPAVIATAGQ